MHLALTKIFKNLRLHNLPFLFSFQIKSLELFSIETHPISFTSCIAVAEEIPGTDISKPEQIKPTISAWICTTKGKWDSGWTNRAVCCSVKIIWTLPLAQLWKQYFSISILSVPTIGSNG